MEQIKYKDAINEIEAILREIDTSEVDIDLLSDKVKRVQYLLKICKDKLFCTEEEIQKILNNTDE